MANLRRGISGQRRARNARQFGKRILVVCGAEKTEKQYLEGLRDANRRANIAIKIRVEPKDPMAVVDAAIRLRDADKDAFDECWVVLDVDDFDIPPVERFAAEQGIRIAISNPCFEYWLLLHFCEHNGNIPDYRRIEPILKKYVENYDKARIVFSVYESRVGDAIKRSEKRLASCGGTTVNPSTNMHQLALQFLP
ncbi:RloB family protein [Streptomyces asoensis]|uniref:RloB family protein n=1 Tax=Streptomyces asoensis TaxID=249586 RepID=UPI003402DE92